MTRVGQGFDVHRFSNDPHRPLWLGLVHLSESGGLQGHSDADVATHALCDALLGAANLGDLGTYFPPEDPTYAGVASATLLARVVALVTTEGYGPVSADVTIVADRPRLTDHRVAMADALSAAVGAAVSVKATSTDGLGFIGRGEGIAALAVVLLEELR